MTWERTKVEDFWFVIEDCAVRPMEFKGRPVIFQWGEGMPKHTKSERLKNRAFREVKENPPARVKRTQRKKGKAAARKQAVAIALSKARKAGARIPKKKR